METEPFKEKLLISSNETRVIINCMGKLVKIFTDGGARGNPGPAGAGGVLYENNEDGDEIVVAKIAKYLGTMTNNQAEYMALIYALEKAQKLGYNEIEINMDSELIIKQLKGEYKVKNAELSKLFLQARTLLGFFKKSTYTHVKREKNFEADALVNKAIDAKL